MPTMVCVPCAVFFKVEKNAVAFEEGMGDGRGRPYKLWFADRYQCPQCGTQVLAGLNKEPVAEHYQKDYADWRAAIRPSLFVDDCPGGAIHHKPPAQPDEGDPTVEGARQPSGGT